MAESSDVQALEKISSEVGESQIKITLSNQCIKAQAFLVDKLRKQIERQKEICSFISNSNFKLQGEIKQAELEIKSLLVAQDTIKSGNIELKKELLLAKEKKSEIAERVSNGEKKYEALWLESKERYEGIPFVRKLLQATSKTQALRENIVALENQSQTLQQEYKTKKEFYAKLDRNRVIELADYLINVLPNNVKAIQDKSAAINRLTNEIETIANDQDAVVSKHLNTIPINQQTVSDENKNTKTIDNGWLNIPSNNDRDIITMPRLQFIHSDFDALNARLEQIKIMKVEVLNTIPSKRVNPDEHGLDFINKKMKHDEFSIFFNKRIGSDADTEKKDDKFARKKLINILEDVKLDKNDTYNIVSKVNIESLKGVNLIGESIVEENCDVPNNTKENEIEEIDLTKASTVNNNTSILIPPTQFLDLSQENLFSNSQQVEVIVTMSMTEPTSTKLSQSLKNSQESIGKKRVSFDLPLSIQEITDTPMNENEIEKKNNTPNETTDNQMDTSSVSDESYSKIKDMILKKHNLDLSPQFTYAKSKMMQLNSDEKVITSKFFQSDKTNMIDSNNKGKTANASKEQQNDDFSMKVENENVNKGVMDIDQLAMSNPKENKIVKPEIAVSGLLFNHGTQGILDSLNMSVSTTGFEEGDTDFPHCIDSSLLLSPKADLPLPMSGENDVGSQDVPNFLSGLRKTGLSFFGQSVAEPKPETSGQNQGSNFNFNFGGGEPKSRGGLFSMFR